MFERRLGRRRRDRAAASPAQGGAFTGGATGTGGSGHDGRRAGRGRRRHGDRRRNHGAGRCAPEAGRAAARAGPARAAARPAVQVAAAARQGRPAAAALPVANGTLFVAPGGDDANPGTMAQPLKTVAQRARPRARHDRRDDRRHHRRTCAAARIRRRATLTFANADSGKNGFYVKYVAYTGRAADHHGRAAHHRLDAVRRGEQHLHGQRDHDAVPAALRQRRQSDSRAQPEPGRERRADFNRLTGADDTGAEHPGRGVGGREPGTT